MGLGSSLQIGKTGLAASQAAIEVAGNNLANIATRGYHRQSISLASNRTQELQQGVYIGRGVNVQQILRHVDEALEGRIRNGIASQAGSAAREEILRQIEALENEFSDVDLSSHLNTFFNAWSELANNPGDNGLRSLVVQEGTTMAQFIQHLKQGLADVRLQVDKSLDGAVAAADDLLKRIEILNEQIVIQEGGGGHAPALRDERGLLLADLAGYLEISTNEQPTGAVDVYVGSLPVILGGKSRGLEMQRRSLEGELQVSVAISDDGSLLTSPSGRIGALMKARTGDVNQAMEMLDDFTNDLIFQVNRVHSQGQGLVQYDQIVGTYQVDDASLALNDTDAGLAFDIGHGSFQLHVTQKSTGQRVTHTVHVDLDGIGGNDTTLNDLAAAVTAVPDVTGSVTPDGRLQIATNARDFEISFSDDSSGVLAGLGINTFFNGTNASDIMVESGVSTNLHRVAAAQGHALSGNGNALEMVALRTQPLAGLNNLSLAEAWTTHVEDYAMRLSQASARVNADMIVRENLEVQQHQISGVNADEEAINLLTFQRTYQGSARFLQVVDELIDTLLSLL